MLLTAGRGTHCKFDFLYFLSRPVFLQLLRADDFDHPAELIPAESLGVCRWRTPLAVSPTLGASAFHRLARSVGHPMPVRLYRKPR